MSFYKNKITLMKNCADSGSYHYNGDIWQEVAAFEADIQPYSSALLQKEYGLLCECKKRAYVKPCDIKLEGLAACIDADMPEYIIIHEEHWANHTMMILKDI